MLEEHSTQMESISFLPVERRLVGKVAQGLIVLV